MRVDVNLARCDGHGTCVDLSPQVFALNDDDEVVVLIEEPGEDLRKGVELAVRACPKAAIKLVD